MSDNQPAVSVDQTVLDRINATIDARGLTKTELARRANMKRGKLNRLLGGQVMRFDDLWALARVLDVSPVELLPLDLAPTVSAAEQRLLAAVRAEDGAAVRTELTRLGIDLRSVTPRSPAATTAAAREIRDGADTLRATLEAAGASAAAALHRAADALDGADE